MTDTCQNSGAIAEFCSTYNIVVVNDRQLPEVRCDCNFLWDIQHCCRCAVISATFPDPSFGCCVHAVSGCKPSWKVAVSHCLVCLAVLGCFSVVEYVATTNSIPPTVLYTESAAVACGSDSYLFIACCCLWITWPDLPCPLCCALIVWAL